MMRADTLQNLFDARDKLSDMIISLKPENDDQRKQLERLMQRNDRITGAINQVIAAKFNEVANGLAEKVSNLEQQTAALNKLNNVINDVQNAIQIADEIIKLVIGILQIAAS